VTLRFNMRIDGLNNWLEGYRKYQALVMDRLFSIMVEHAALTEQWMRINAPWEDSCLPDKSYLRAVPYRDDRRKVVGIVAFYDMQLYNERCPDQDVTFDFSFEHEFKDFADAGAVSILNPSLGLSVFDEPFPDAISAVIGEFF
jgi:hypothetical protein